MLAYMKKGTISRALGFGTNNGARWMRTTKTMVDGKSRWQPQYQSREEVFRSVTCGSWWWPCIGSCWGVGP